MPRIPEATIERIKDATDIVEVVSDHVQLTKRGKNYFGICPFHSERTASFSVNPDLQIYRCFGCGEGGNAFRFIQKIDGVSFVEAVSFLAQRCGLPLTLERNTDVQQANDELFRANEIASKYFHHMLLNDDVGQNACVYLEGREVSRDTVESLRIGFAPHSWDDLIGVLERRGISPPTAERAGLAKKKQKGSGLINHFRGRIIFPITNATGRVVGFGARALTDDEKVPKYLNSPETPIYRKSLILYGLSEARSSIRERDLALVVEGYMDVARLVQHGLSNVVATSGTALTADQCRLLARYSKRVALLFDGDAAGSTAAERGLETLLGANIEARVVLLPSGHDPDSFVRAESAESLQALVDSSLSVLDFYLDRLATRFDVTSVEGKTQVVAHLKPVITRINDAVRRDLMLQEVAYRLGVDEQAVRSELQRETLDPREPRDSHPATIPVRELPPIEKQFLGLLLKFPRFIAPSAEVIDPDDFLDPRSLAVSGHLFARHRQTVSLDLSMLIEEFEDASLANTVAACAVEEFDEEQLEELWSDTVRRFKSDMLTRRIESVKQELAAAAKKGDEKLVEQLAGNLEELVRERVSSSAEQSS